MRPCALEPPQQNRLCFSESSGLCSTSIAPAVAVVMNELLGRIHNILFFIEADLATKEPTTPAAKLARARMHKDIAHQVQVVIFDLWHLVDDIFFNEKTYPYIMMAALECVGKEKEEQCTLGEMACACHGTRLSPDHKRSTEHG